MNKVVIGSAYNLVVNTAAAYGLCLVASDDNPRDVAIIVATDTVFRMILSHAIAALKLTPGEPKTVGNLIFLCSTLITQPLSVKCADRYFHVKKPPSYLNTMAYIFWGWKASLMGKNIWFTSKNLFPVELWPS